MSTTERGPRLSVEDAARASEIATLAANGASGVPALIACLRDRSWAVRRMVVAALADLGDVALAPLVDALQTRDNEAQIAAVVDALSASAASPGRVEAQLEDIVRSSDAALLCDAAQIFGRRRSTSSVAVLAGLTAHADDNVALAAVEALGRIGRGAGVEALIALACGDNFFRTFPAIDALGRSGDHRAIAALADLVTTPTYSNEAARALGRTGDLRAVTPLAGLLGAAHATGVRVAATALAELDDRRADRVGPDGEIAALVRSAAPRQAATSLVRAAGGADTEERIAIARVLAWTDGGEAAIAFLFGLLDAEPRLSRVAIASLRALGPQVSSLLDDALRRGDSAQRAMLLPLVVASATVEVVPYLQDPEPAVRAAACEALARTGAVHAVPALFELLADPDRRVALGAVAAIQSLGSTETESRVLATLHDRSAPVRRAAFRLLGYFGYVAGFEAARTAITDADAQVRDAAMTALAYIQDPRGVAALVEVCRGPERAHRAAAARVLAQVKPTSDVFAALRGALSDEDAWVRYYACQSLGKLRDETASPLLVVLLDDPAGQVRVAAVEALARASHPSAREALERTLRSDDHDVQRAALVGLGQSGRVESVPMLLLAAKNPDPATRLVAISAIAKFDVPEVVAALGDASLDADDSVSGAAVELLGARPGEQATRVLAGLSGEARLRARVARSLSVDVEGRVDGLVAALDDADEQRAPLLAVALARLRHAHAQAGLVHVLAGASSVASRCAAAEAIALLFVPSLRDALASAAERDPDPRVRRLCVKLLEP